MAFFLLSEWFIIFARIRMFIFRFCFAVHTGYESGCRSCSERFWRCLGGRGHKLVLSPRVVKECALDQVLSTADDIKMILADCLRIITSLMQTSRHVYSYSLADFFIVHSIRIYVAQCKHFDTDIHAAGLTAGTAGRSLRRHWHNFV
jgi:hypothetical protein